MYEWENFDTCKRERENLCKVSYQLFLLIKKLFNLAYNAQSGMSVVVNDEYTQSDANITVIKLYCKIKTRVTGNEKVATGSCKFLVIARQVL